MNFHPKQKAKKGKLVGMDARKLIIQYSSAYLQILFQFGGFDRGLVCLSFCNAFLAFYPVLLKFKFRSENIYL